MQDKSSSAKVLLNTTITHLAGKQNLNLQIETFFSNLKMAQKSYLVASQASMPSPPCRALLRSPVGLLPGVEGLVTVEVQLGEPWTSAREGALSGGGVGCQGAGKPRWDNWQASKVVDELTEEFEGCETSDEVSEHVPFGESRPTGIPKSQCQLTWGHSFRVLDEFSEINKLLFHAMCRRRKVPFLL